jgi:hypothetical protein
VIIELPKQERFDQCRAADGLHIIPKAGLAHLTPAHHCFCNPLKIYDGNAADLKAVIVHFETEETEGA